jgi:hypothetical protein
MNVWKPWKATLVLALLFLVPLFLPACDGAATPTPRPEQSPTFTPPADVTPPLVTIKQELEEQRDMLRALVEAEQGRGKDVSQAEGLLDQADSALQSDDLALAREKLREAGEALGVRLP